jgi:site-specific recombinase XerD
MPATVLKFRTGETLSLEEAKEKYLLFKRAQGLRTITVRGHHDVLHCFFGRHPEAWEESNLEKALYEFMGEDIAPATYNIRRNYLRQFFDWCILQGLLCKNPIDNLRKKRDPGRIVVISEDTIKRLLALPDQSTFVGLRDYAILLTTLDSGIRPSEAFRLASEDFHPVSMELHIKSDNAKTGVSRTLPLAHATVQALQKLGEFRPKNCRFLFPTYEGMPMNRHTWNDRMEKYSVALGEKIRPYDLRHTFAVFFLRNGGHGFALQRILGHTDMSMTKRYVHLAHGDIQEQHLQASPISNMFPKKSRLRKVQS